MHDLGLWLKAHTAPDEEIVKSAGVSWWGFTHPQILYYAERNGIERDPIADVKTLDDFLQHERGRFAYLLFHQRADARRLGVRIRDDETVRALETRLIQDFVGEDVSFNGNHFKVFHTAITD